MPIKNLKKNKKCQELLADYYDKSKKYGLPKAEPLIFDLKNIESVNTISEPLNSLKLLAKEMIASEITFYNPSKLIEQDGKKRLAIRVEPKSREDNSHVLFFEEKNGIWLAVGESPHLHLQDPFYVDNIHGWQILGGVEVKSSRKEKHLSYRTVFYRYKNNINEIAEPFAIGPQNMKDIRLIELENGRIGVFTRPQGGIYGHGKIAYLEISDLAELTSKKFLEAKMIEDQFSDGEWGGVNDLYLLKDGRIGILGHIAHFENNYRKNYYSMSFIFDPKTLKATPIKIIANAADVGFTIGRKKEILGDVIFSGGLKIEGRRAKLYAGINDIGAACFDIANPFINC